jgi:hypothetical protein
LGLNFFLTIKGLLELEASLPSYVLQLQITPPKRIVSTKDGYLKRKYREEKRLEDIHNVIVITFVKNIYLTNKKKKHIF